MHRRDGKFEHAVFVRIVGGEHFLVMGEPCIRIVASGFLVVSGKSGLIGESGYIFPAFDAFYKGGKEKTEVRGGIRSAGAHNDEGVEILRIFCGGVSCNEGTHAVAEQEVLFPGKFLHDGTPEGMYVVNDGFPAVLFGEIAEFFVVFGGGTMSDMVMAEYGKAVLGEICHERLVSSDVLDHAV